MASSSSPSPSPSPRPSFSSPSPDAASASQLTAAFVKAWGSLDVPLDLARGQSAYWEFKTAAHDISFGAKFTAGRSTTVVRPLERVERADQLLSHGSYTASEVGTLTLTFDNSYSKLRGKNLLYSATVSSLSGAPDRNAVPFGEMRLTAYGPAVIEGLRESDGIYLVSLPYGKAFFAPQTILSARPGPARSINDRAMVGVDLFFNNNLWDAEAFFEQETQKQPVFSLIFGSLKFLRAMMTWSASDITEANSCLKQSRNFISALLPQVSTLKHVGRFLARSSGPDLTPQQLEYTVLQAEAFLLQAMLLFTDESYLSFIKAGLKIRSAWKLYERCDVTLRGYDEKTRASLGPAVIGGIQFGLGCFNVIISILPSVVLRLVSALGFPSDRVLGLRMLEECASVTSVRQPLSALMLLFVHVVIPSFFTVRPAHHIAEAHRILRQAFERWPQGALFLWMEGRMNRSRRDLPASIESFTRSAAGQPNWAQLQHLCAYELGWSHFFRMDYTASAKHWERLERESSWSKAFFIYMQAACALSSDHGLVRAENESAGNFAMRLIGVQNAAATPLFAKVEPSIVRKFGGKALGIETFVAARSVHFLSLKQRPFLPALELMYTFYGFIQMPDPLLLRALAEVDAIVAPSSSASTCFNRRASVLPPSIDDLALARLVRAAILKALRRWNEAKLALEALDADVKDGDLQRDRHILPFARFELASLVMEQVVEKDAAVKILPQHAQPCSIDQAVGADAAASAPITAAAWQVRRLELLDSAHTQLKRIESAKSEFPFKSRLHMRVHLACVEVGMLRRHWSDVRGNIVADEDLGGDDHLDKDGQAVVDSDEEKE